MSQLFCPGSKLLRQPQPRLFKCPSCGEQVEIWTDEIKRACPSCKMMVVSELKDSCLDWCKYGKDCVGNEIYDNYMQNKRVSIKKILNGELEKHFSNDPNIIEHTKNVLLYVEKLLEIEKADPFIVSPAAILHNLDKNEPDLPNIQKILFRAGIKKTDIGEICHLIKSLHEGMVLDTLNFKVLNDAILLANLQISQQKSSGNETNKKLNIPFLTNQGKFLATKLY